MKIDIYLTEDKKVSQSIKKIGLTQENRSTILRFHIEKEITTEEFYIDFEKPDGTKVKSEALTITNNKIEYEVTNSLLGQEGIIKVQAILQRSDGYILKYPILEFLIIDSINAIDEIEEEQPDFVSQTQAVINLIETNGDGNSYLSNDGTYKLVSSGSSGYD